MSGNGSLKHSVSAISVVVEAEADATEADATEAEADATGAEAEAGGSEAAAVDALRFRHIGLEVIIRRLVAEVKAALGIRQLRDQS